jgi:O-methyltransferase involved in polyketide biosynthesis
VSPSESRAAPRIREIKDTARWAAVYRARESERSDALFRDPFARRLPGTRGEEIAASLPASERHSSSPRGFRST